MDFNIFFNAWHVTDTQEIFAEHFYILEWMKEGVERVDMLRIYFMEISGLGNQNVLIVLTLSK